MKGWLRLLIGVIISSGLMWWVIAHINIHQVVELLGSVNLRWISIAMVVVTLGFFVRALRWSFLLNIASNGRPSWKNSSCGYLTSLALNNVIPLRAGDAYRIFHAHQMGIEVMHATIWMAVERVGDLALLLAMVAICAGVLPVWQALSLGMALIALASGSAVFLIRKRRVNAGDANPPLQTNFSRWAVLSRLWLPLSGALRTISSPIFIIRFFILGVVAWGCESLVFICCCVSLNLHISIVDAVRSMGLATLSTLLPGMPGHVGTFHAGAVAGLTSGGLSAEAALSVATLTHLMLWIPVTVIGLVLLAFNRKTGKSPVKEDILGKSHSVSTAEVI